MKRLFVIQNQRQQYLSKDGLWLETTERTHFFKTENHDIALNTLIEANSKDIDLRLSIIEVQADNKGLPEF